MISIIIPAYNEEENTMRIEKELLPVLKNTGMTFEVIIIDDGSKDRTYEIAKSLEKKHKTIRTIKHTNNLGLGAALRTGIKNAKGDILIPLDSDFTFHPREIPKLLEEFKKGDADCVIGSHFSKEGKTENVPFHRIFLSKSCNFLYQILLMQRINSISSIFRLYKTSHLKGMKLESTKFDINAEILFKLIQDKRKIVEVPVTLTTRKYGVSKLDSKKEIKNHISLLSKILLWRIKG